MNDTEPEIVVNVTRYRWGRESHLGPAHVSEGPAYVVAHHDSKRFDELVAGLALTGHAFRVEIDEVHGARKETTDMNIDANNILHAGTSEGVLSSLLDLTTDREWLKGKDPERAADELIEGAAAARVRLADNAARNELVREIEAEQAALDADTDTDTTITATITGRGADSAVPDRADAVDAAITLDGVHLCDVTLLEDRGELDTWGSPDHWCSDWRALLDADGDDGRRLTDEIVGAVRTAAAE